ncbi:MAG TPA: XdhC family protein [Steroidobacteraceae bacterium]|jgi:xanthine/CO dehydrogenase XdhC/CoxF family maturation factor
MNHRPISLDEFFRSYRQRREPLVLATVARTIGSTYRKAGAQMLLAGDGSAAGLLSGGCLEADLMERARGVLQSGIASVAEYDTRSSDDVLWGIGLGCEGAMSILLTKLDSDNDYQPFATAELCRREQIPVAFAIVVATSNERYPLGRAYWLDSPEQPPAAVRSACASMQSRRKAAASSASTVAATVTAEDATFLIVPVQLPTRLLLLGAGPDAMPLVEIAGLMGWQVTVMDHRPAYAIADRFPRAQHVMLHPAGSLAEILAGEHYDAAVVMSHHLPSDQVYLAALADSAIPYIGLLGPELRRVRVMTELGAQSRKFAGRLYGPIGLDIGARTPEAIALAIVSEIQAVLAGRPGGSFSARMADE